jgi:hypothetical protein
MKFYLLTTVSFLFSLTAAAPVLKFQGSGPYSCSDSVKSAVSHAIGDEVETTAEDKGYVPRGTNWYTDRRTLRGIGEDGRELTWCTNNGCPPNNPYQYCTIIGCNRRREQTVPSTERMVESASYQCRDLVENARDKLKDLADQQKQSNLANGRACGLLFSNITITCYE